MKVLHVIDSEGLYGAEVTLLHLASEQERLGLQPAILNMSKSENLKHSLKAEATRMGIQYWSLPVKTGPDIYGALKIIRFAMANGHLLLHSHGYKPNILLGLMPRRIRKLPIVTTLHGWTNTERFSKMTLYELADIFSLRFLDVVVLVSSAMRTKCRLAKCKNPSTLVIPNGIPLRDFSKSEYVSGDEIGLFCEKAFTIGAIGRLSKEKGFDYLIESFHLLAQNGFDGRLIIIGDGPKRNSLEALVSRLGLKDKVFMPGYRQDAWRYMPFFDIFAVSSITEGLPITLLEAMQAKTPIVATGVGGIPEALENGRAGVVVEPCKPDGLATATARIYDDPTLAYDMTTVAYEKATTEYSSTVMASKYLNVYENLIAANRDQCLGNDHAAPFARLTH